MNRADIWNIWRYHPAAVGRMVGFSDLTDELHGRWMQHILYGAGDYTLQAHRLSYKSSCLSVSLAMWCVLNHARNAILVRKTDADVGESIKQAKKVFENEAFCWMAAQLLGQSVSVLKSTANAVTVSTYQHLLFLSIYGCCFHDYILYIVFKSAYHLCIVGIVLTKW